MREIFIITYLAISRPALSNCTMNKPEGSFCPEDSTVSPVAAQKRHIIGRGGCRFGLFTGFCVVLYFTQFTGELRLRDL